MKAGILINMKKVGQKTKIHVKKSLTDKIREVLSIYVKTQLFLTFIVTVAVWFILSRLGVQFALLLAMMTGAASVVPMLGMFTLGIIASLVSIFDATRFLPTLPSVCEGVVIAIIYILLNMLIDLFLSPYLLGRSSKIHPFILLVFVLIGSSLFGIWGALLTTPMVLVVKTILEYYDIQ